MRLLVFLLVGMLMFTLGSAASAGLIVKTDMDTALADVQTQREVMIGDIFDVGVWLDLTQPSKMESYWFTVRYNADALEFVGRSESYPSGWQATLGDRPSPFSGTGDSILGPGQYGELREFEAFSFSTMNSPSMFQAATLTFKVKATPATGWSTQITPGMFDPGLDGYFDPTVGDQVPYESVGGGITVVPEPSSLVLLTLGVGGVCAVALRRRRS